MNSVSSTIKVATIAAIVAVTLAAVALGSVIRQPDAPSRELGLGDDWATRHPIAVELGLNDDWSTRHAQNRALGLNDDFGTRNVDASEEPDIVLTEADDYGTRNRQSAPTRFGPPGR